MLFRSHTPLSLCGCERGVCVCVGAVGCFHYAVVGGVCVLALYVVFIMRLWEECVCWSCRLFSLCGCGRSVCVGAVGCFHYAVVAPGLCLLTRDLLNLYIFFLSDF